LNILVPVRRSRLDRGPGAGVELLESVTGVKWVNIVRSCTRRTLKLTPDAMPISTEINTVSRKQTILAITSTSEVRQYEQKVLSSVVICYTTVTRIAANVAFGI